MAGFAGFGQGFSNAINANSVNNERDAQTKILGFQQEAFRRAQLGDIYGARALKLMADQIAGQSGVGGPPAPPMATPPMPGTQSMPAAQGPAIQTSPTPPQMQGAPLPPYQSLSQAIPLTLAQGGAESTGLGNFSTMPQRNVGLNQEKAIGPTEAPTAGGAVPRYAGEAGNTIPAGSPGVRPSLGLQGPGGWGYPSTAAGLYPDDSEAPAPDEQAPGQPATVAGAAPTGTPAQGAAPAAQAPMQVDPRTGLPQGPGLSNNLSALNAIRALKQIGAPDDVIMSALGHMEPIFAVEYKATISAQQAAIHTYQAQMAHYDRMEAVRTREAIASANRESRETIKANELEEKIKFHARLGQKWDEGHADTLKRIDVMQQRVNKMPNSNSQEAQQFKIQKQLSDKAHADLHSLYGAFSKSADPAEKAVLSQQILDKQNEIDGYTKSLVDSFDRLGGGKMERPGGATTSGVPVPPKSSAPRVTATNPRTGERVEMRDGKWVPLQPPQ